MAFSMSTTKAKAVGAVVAATLAVGALAGCTGQTAGSEQQDVNRQYLSQVNQVMDDLEISLASFTDAVSRNDVVGMQTQAENALSKLDSLDSIEAPEELSEVQQSYQDGTAQLREALSSYVALYTEISSATESQPFDWSTYDARLAEIQESYDAGIDALEAGDKAAAEVEGGAQGAASDQQAVGGDQKQDGAAAQ